MNNWDEYIETLARLVNSRENYQRILGELAQSVRDEYGLEAMERLSNDLKERHGLTISASTLHNYAWVYSKTHNLDLPKDLAFRALQMIAGTPNPEEWATKIKSGMTAPEVYKAIKGEPRRSRVACPQCQHHFYVPTQKEAIKQAKKYLKGEIIR